jgi:AI-2 transport protein TqsA
VLETLLMVVIITVFIQLEASNYRRKITRVLGSARPMRATNKTLAEVQRYLAGKVLLSAATGALSGLVCLGLGIPNPLLWGVIAFLLNFIPYVGSLIAAVPPVLLGLLHGGGALAAMVAVGYFVINLAENIVEPRVMGRMLDVSPLAVLLSMLVWGFVLGPVGALLSMPLTMVVRDILARYPDLKWIAVLLSEEVDPKTEAPAATDVAPARTVRE